MALLKHNPSQTRITDYYDIANEVDLLAKSKPELMNAFHHADGQHTRQVDFHSFFNKIIANAEKNASRLPHSRRHDSVVKKFATSLFLYGGPMAYNLIHQNMPDALPSLRTVQRMIHADYHLIAEGQLQFDELVIHLTKHNAPFVVAVSEDATRIIARVEYDFETNRMVGFVLPCDDNGMPIADSFLATSFETIEECFKSNQLSKLAYVYVAQCVSPAVPAFCLGCMGISNSFCYIDVLKRWRHIYLQCQKRQITVVSFGADGDTRVLRAMKISTRFKVSSNDRSLYDQSPSYLACEFKLPKEWSWFWQQKTTSLLFIQDYIHIAVKLKARLLKPSIIIPMGKYLAGLHHLKILFETFSKDQHGIRQKDLDHKDRQNFDAVSHITHNSVLSLLEQLPDAKGTYQYLHILKSFMDAFLNKTLSPLQRVKKVWYTIFFLRYWHHWLLLQNSYAIKDNFITSNAYTGIELNGHAIILFLIILRDKITDGNKLFYPWLLGSQACEQTFRAARSMTSTFSTVINFSMYGFLQRLHRLQIQTQLESEMEETGICYPRVMAHVKKTGFSDANVIDATNLLDISDEDIATTVQNAKEEAITAITELGMSVKEGEWEEVILQPVSAGNDNDDDHDTDDDDDERINDHKESTNEQASDKSELSDKEKQQDIQNMQQLGLIEDERVGIKMKQISSSTISMYSPQAVDTEKTKKHSEFVQVSHNGRTVYIRKSTAVWLFQEYERVSSDRLFRVRIIQPNSSESHANISRTESDVENLPKKSEIINIGDICVFHNNRSKWKLGKVLHFHYHTGKSSKAQQCTLSSLHVNSDQRNTSVVCSLFHWHPPLSTQTYVLTADHNVCTSKSFHLNEYAFTLSKGCFEHLRVERTLDSNLHSVMMQDNTQIELACAKYITLSHESAQFLEQNLKIGTICIDDHNNEVSSSYAPPNNIWKKYGCYGLTTVHRAHLVGGHLLDDVHMGAAQALLKKQFPNIDGFKNTLLQYCDSAEPLKHPLLQIIHVKLTNTDHWIVMSTLGCREDEVELYDSLQLSPNLDTQIVIAKYLRSQSSSIKIKVLNVAMQNGSTDCGVYAIAMMTSIAYKEDPVHVVYNQQDLRLHLKQCFEKGILTKFPISKKRRLNKRVSKDKTCLVYCTCRLPDFEDGTKMVECDRCKEWYHVKCLKCDMELTSDDMNDEWFCEKCL